MPGTAGKPRPVGLFDTSRRIRITRTIFATVVARLLFEASSSGQPCRVRVVGTKFMPLFSIHTSPGCHLASLMCELTYTRRMNEAPSIHWTLAYRKNFQSLFESAKVTIFWFRPRQVDAYRQFQRRLHRSSVGEGRTGIKMTQ